MAKPKGQHDGLMYYTLSVNAKAVGKWSAAVSKTRTMVCDWEKISVSLPIHYICRNKHFTKRKNYTQHFMKPVRCLILLLDVHQCQKASFDCVMAKFRYRQADIPAHVSLSVLMATVRQTVTSLAKPARAKSPAGRKLLLL